MFGQQAIPTNLLVLNELARKQMMMQQYALLAPRMGLPEAQPQQPGQQQGQQPGAQGGQPSGQPGSGGPPMPPPVPPMSPEQDTAVKAVQKTKAKQQTQQIDQAMQQGVTGQNVLNAYGVPPELLQQMQQGMQQGQPQQPGQPGALNMALAGQPQQPQGSGTAQNGFQGVTQKGGMFAQNKIDQQGNFQFGGPFGSLFGIAPDAFATAQNAMNNTPQNQLNLKREEGKLPLGRGRKEELEIQGMNDFFKNAFDPSSNTLSAESSKLLGNVNSSIKQIDALEAAFEKNPNLFKWGSMPNNETRQQVDTMIEDITDTLGRLRSGGAISKDEEKRFLGQLPARGLKGGFEGPKTTRQKLTKLRGLFKDIKSTVEPKDSAFRSKIQQALQAGATREQIYRIYAGGGKSEGDK